MLSLTTAPAAEPVDLDDVKAHLRITHTAEDAYLTGLIAPARQWCEVFTARSFINQTWTLKLYGFGPDPIVLPRPPLSSVTSIQYQDEADATQTWAASKYQVVNASTSAGPYDEHGWVVPAEGETYPTTDNRPDDVTITYVGGYGTAAGNVPAAIRHAILIVIEDYYDNRASQLIGTGPVIHNSRSAESLLWPFRVFRQDLRFD